MVGRLSREFYQVRLLPQRPSVELLREQTGVCWRTHLWNGVNRLTILDHDRRLGLTMPGGVTEELDMKGKMSRRHLLGAIGCGAALGPYASPRVLYGEGSGSPRKPPPVIHVTDLFRPHCDPDDHWDLACVFALAYAGEIDLQGVLIDFAPQPQGDHNPDVMAVAQMNYVAGLHVPVAIGASRPLRSRDDSQPEADESDRGGVRMVLEILHRSPAPVIIHITGSCRDVAIAGKKAPQLFAEKCAGIYLNAGTGSPDVSKAAQLEYNVSLAPLSYAAIFDLPCPIYWMPCFEEMQSDRVVREYGTHYLFRQGEILPHLSERMQNFFACVLGKKQDHRWLTYLTGPRDEPLLETLGTQDRHMWCTGGFLHAAGKTVVADGSIIERDRAGDSGVFSFDPIRLSCSDKGVTQWQHDQAARDRYIFHVRKTAHYQGAMTQAMRTLLRRLP